MKLIYYERLKLLQTIFINTINTLNHKYNSFSVSSVYEFEVNRIHWKITKLSEKEYIVDLNCWDELGPWKAMQFFKFLVVFDEQVPINNKPDKLELKDIIYLIEKILNHPTHES